MLRWWLGEATRHGFAHLGILGTRHLMKGPVYPKALERYGIASEIPRERINAIILNLLD
jgi:aspartate racemase